VITAQFHYPGIQTAIVTGGWHHPKSYPFSMDYTVVADGGTLEYSSLGRPPGGRNRAATVRERFSGAILFQTEKWKCFPWRIWTGYRAEIEYFLDCCRHRRTPDLCPPDESADAVALARCMLEARNRNGEKIRCNLLKENETGVMFWAGRDTLEEIRSLGVRCGQLWIPGDCLWMIP